ncbi:MAG TPA: methylated DNA-protein cysteine methyltransferase [Pyrinomonadaceae bacterium]|jgi:hypothetical protein|nr:methylated DNA-protein cysteine methyltransferase [Pyrinomonadaceae bacterium]
MKQRKTWREKLSDSKDLPKVLDIPDRLRAKWGTGNFVIPAPIEVDELMRRVPKGKLTTINHIRMALARKHDTTVACPLTTGIFAWLAANAAEEDASEKKKRVTPYWRTLKAGGVLNEKYPGGVTAQKKRLLAEGHKLTKKGKKHLVADLEKSLFDFD